MHFYTDPSREHDAHTLPDAETFEVDANGRTIGNPYADRQLPGYYWWACSPGCLPDGDPIGPFASEALAIADARSNASDDADATYVEHAVKGWKNLGANYDDGRQIKLIDTDRTSTAFVMVGGRDHNANARLIEAAPSLLNACRLFISSIENRKKGALTIDPTYEDWQTIEYAARQAIADAQGGGPWSTSSGALTRQLRKDLDLARKQGGAS